MPRFIHTNTVALIHQIPEKYHKILILVLSYLIYSQNLYATESIRVLIPFKERSMKIVIKKGRILIPAPLKGECVNTTDTDDIGRIVSKKGREGESAGGDKLIEVERIDGERTINLRLEASGIVITGTEKKIDERFESLLFENGGGTISINGKLLRGNLEIRLVGGGQYRFINEIDIEEYLRYTISREMNPLWPIEALKAQTVLARTYVLKKKYQSNNCLYDIGSSTLDQVYGGFNEDSMEVLQAVSGTTGEVIKYNGEIVDALYHSCCGGRTSSSKEVFGSDTPYLQGVECDCKGDCPYGKGWSYRMKTKSLEKILGLSNIKKIQSESGRVIITADKNLVISKNSLREKVGYNLLKSSQYNVRLNSGEVVFEGRGFGHTVGLCQYGAKRMAEEGKDYIEIIKHYFKGVTIEKIY